MQFLFRCRRALYLSFLVLLLGSTPVSADEITVVDMTSIVPDANTEHDCSKYLVTTYDETNHWQTCSVCKKTYHKLKHTLSGYWTLGDSCSSQNVYRVSCSCGYSYTKPNTRLHKHTFLNKHPKYHDVACEDCGGLAGDIELHKDASGNVLNCSHSGVCAVCGYQTGEHNADAYYWEHFNQWATGTGECVMCNENLLSDMTVKQLKHKGSAFTAKLQFTVKSGLSITGFHETGRIYPILKNDSVDTIASSVSGNTVTVSVAGKLGEPGVRLLTCGSIYGTGRNGETFEIYVGMNVKTEDEAPVITDIKQSDLATKHGWATKKEITIYGTEAYDSTVQLSVTGQNTDNSVTSYIKDATVSVVNGAWIYSFVPDLEADEIGKKLLVTVSDNSCNQTEHTFVIKKVDGIAPNPAPTVDLTDGWSKTKDWKAICTDGGSGAVQVSVVDADSYISSEYSGDCYTKQYRFTGDLYGTKEIPVSYKDATGNVAVVYLNVGWLDNTAPDIRHITSMTDYGTSFIEVDVVDAGSGIAAFGLSREDGSVTWGKSSQFVVSQEGSYTVWCKDKVGNVSSKTVQVSVKSHVTFDANEGTCDIKSSDYFYGDTYDTLRVPVKQGYTFDGWYVSDTYGYLCEGDPVIRKAKLTVTAKWRPLSYTISFHENMQSFETAPSSGSMHNMKVQYCMSVSLPANTFAKQTYSNAEYNGGERVLKDSVFLGWSTQSQTFTPQYTDCDTIIESDVLPNHKLDLYAVWDDCPEFLYKEFPDRYFTLDDAKSGKITEQELLSTVRACDRETKELKPKTAEQALENDVGITLYNYDASDFLQLTDSADVSVTYKVKDDIGNLAYLTVTVHVLDGVGTSVQEDMLRNISGVYYGKDASEGGLNDDSLWRKSGYSSMLSEALYGDTYTHKYSFTAGDLHRMREEMKRR